MIFTSPRDYSALSPLVFLHSCLGRLMGASPRPGPTFPGEAAELPGAGGCRPTLPALLLLGGRAGCQAGRGRGLRGGGGWVSPASPTSSLGSPQVRSEAFPKGKGAGAPPGCSHFAPRHPSPASPPQGARRAPTRAGTHRSSRCGEGGGRLGSAAASPPRSVCPVSPWIVFN